MKITISTISGGVVKCALAHAYVQPSAGPSSTDTYDFSTSAPGMFNLTVTLQSSGGAGGGYTLTVTDDTYAVDVHNQASPSDPPLNGYQTFKWNKVPGSSNDNEGLTSSWTYIQQFTETVVLRVELYTPTADAPAAAADGQ